MAEFGILGLANRQHRGFEAYLNAAIAHTEAEKSHIEDVKSHMDAEHIVAVTAYMHPFEPTATAHKKMANPFYSKWCLRPRTQIDC